MACGKHALHCRIPWKSSYCARLGCAQTCANMSTNGQQCFSCVRIPPFPSPARQAGRRQAAGPRGCGLTGTRCPAAVGKNSDQDCLFGRGQFTLAFSFANGTQPSRHSGRQADGAHTMACAAHLFVRRARRRVHVFVWAHAQISMAPAGLFQQGLLWPKLSLVHTSCASIDTTRTSSTDDKKAHPLGDDALGGAAQLAGGVQFGRQRGARRAQLRRRLPPTKLAR